MVISVDDYNTHTSINQWKAQHNLIEYYYTTILLNSWEKIADLYQSTGVTNQTAVKTTGVRYEMVFIDDIGKNANNKKVNYFNL